MNRRWVIARHEFTRHVFRKRYLFSLLSLPLMLLTMVGLIALMIAIDSNETPLGVVDPARQLQLDLPLPEEDERERVDILRFETETEARAALEAEEIQAYYVLPENFAHDPAVQLVYFDEPGDNATRYFRDLTLANLLLQLPPERAARAMEGINLSATTPDNERSFSPEKLLDTVLPALTSFVFLFVVFSAAGYFIAIVAEEKENRTIEYLTTSIPSGVFISGKILGLIGVSALQIAVWLAFALAALLLGLPLAGVELPETLTLAPTTLLFMAAIFVPAYVMVVALLTAIGAAVTETSEGQQFAALITLPMSMSFYLFAYILSNPNSPLAIALSMFPITAPTLMPIRWAITAVPIWQIAATSAGLTLAALAGFWLAARALELGLLRFEKRLKLRELFTRRSA